jgi:hypothetical protein
VVKPEEKKPLRSHALGLDGDIKMTVEETGSEGWIALREGGTNSWVL